MIQDLLPKNLEMKLADGDNVAAKVAGLLLDSGAVFFRPKQPFRFDSGILSPVYVDNRRLISLPKERKIIIRELINLIKNKVGIPDVVAGVATAGITHAAWIADSLNIPMVYVRPKPKDHGRENQVEGIIRRGQKVLVVEDMVSTAGSSVSAIGALRKLGAKVTGEVAIYTHQMKESHNNFKKIKITFSSLTDLTAVAVMAKERGYFKKDQLETILAWGKNPKGWGRKMGFE